MCLRINTLKYSIPEGSCNEQRFHLRASIKARGIITGDINESFSCLETFSWDNLCFHNNWINLVQSAFMCKYLVLCLHWLLTETKLDYKGEVRTIQRIFLSFLGKITFFSCFCSLGFERESEVEVIQYGISSRPP